MQKVIAADFASLTTHGRSFSFLGAPSTNLYVDADAGRMVDVDRLRNDLRAFAD